MTNIIDSLNWRSAIKKFDTTKKLSDTQIGMLFEALRLSPSSFGLQPWKFVVVTNDEIREKLRAAAWGQPQITEASHLIVFAIRKNVNEEFVDEYVQAVAKERGVSVDALKDFGDMMKGSINRRSADENKNWATHQLYLSLGVLLSAAAVEGIDACPMEGFDPKQFDEILGLEAMGLESRVIAAVGFRSADEKAALLPKVRFSKEEVIVEVK